MDPTNCEQLLELLYQLERDNDAGAWKWDITSNQVKLTPKTTENLGADWGEQCELSDFLSPFAAASKDQLLDKLHACLEGHPFKQEFDVNCEHKKLRKVVVSARPLVEQDSVTGVVGSVRDISEDWYQLERHQLAIEAGNVGIWEYHWPSDKLHWNEAMFDFYGFPVRDNLVFSDWEAALHPDDKYNTTTAFQASVKQHRPFSYQFKITRGEDETRYIKSVAKTFYDQDDKPLKSIGVNIDVTRLKEQEEELVVEKALGLQRSKLAAIGELAAGIGHEINNPLAIDMGTINMLKEHLEQKGAYDDKVKQLLEKHAQSTKRIKSIVLGMRRLVKDDSNSAKQKINVKSLIDNLLNLVGEIYKKEGVEITVDVPEDVWVKGHFGELQQVLMNLLGNAKDAVKDFSAKAISIKVRVDDENRVTVNIADNGLGIPKHLQKRVFDNFFSTKPSGQGSGIGLSIVRRIINEHGGDVSLTSEVGVGSTLAVTLPCVHTLTSLQPPQADGEENASSNGCPPQGTLEPVSKVQSSGGEVQVKRAVIVDDEPMLLQILKGYLEAMGITCFVTTQPRLALKAMSADRYDALITDMCMPEMDGLTLIRQAKTLGVENVRYIIMTGGITKELSPKEQEELAAAGDVIYKPFGQEEIKELLSKEELQPC